VRRPGVHGRRVEPQLTDEGRIILGSLAKTHLAQLRQYAPEIRGLMSGRET
jgi:hypothetical protein